MKRLKLFTLTTVVLLGLSNGANADATLLSSDDFVGVSFWITSMGMLAATLFVFFERGSVVHNWRTILTVAGIITGVSFVNYVYIRNVWAVTGDLPILYRYIDWFITVPLQVTLFYLILSTVRKVPKKLFWKLLVGSFTMLFGGYLGESGHIPGVAGFVIAITGWVYILYEIYSGEAGVAVAKSGNRPMVTAYNLMKKIVAIGWAIYPLGYIFAFFSGGVDLNSLNVIYNIADFVNKIAFVLVIWIAAMQNTTQRYR